MKNNKVIIDIIEYWRMVEFLNQNKFPYATKYQKRVLNDLQVKKEKQVNSLTIFERIPLNKSIKETINYRTEVVEKLPFEGTEKHILVGKVSRNSIIEALFSLIKEKEVVEKNKEKICMYALKVSKEGMYIQGSLKVSPLLWGTAICFRYSDNVKDKLSLEEYNHTMTAIENYFMKDESELFVNDKLLRSIYDYVYEIFINRWIKNIEANFEGSLIYTRFKTKDELERLNDSLEDYSDLMTGFFQKDFELVIEQIKKGIVPSKDFFNYVTSLIDKNHTNEYKSKINVRSDDTYLTKLLDPMNAPIGKWPSEYQPAFMQQVAINAYLTNKSDYFSVNGPPGTGKTTLLKEIVAENVVQVASLLAEYNESDDAFVKKKFENGTKKENGYDKKFSNYFVFEDKSISNYGMLVASSNNAAVENITKDLPEYRGLHGSLKDETCAEVRKLFDLTEDQRMLEFTFSIFDEQRKRREVELIRKDIYFSSLAHSLKNNENMKTVELFSEWGLISAPLGKRSNLKEYYYKVLHPIIKHIGKNRASNKKEFDKAKHLFKQQLKKVKSYQKELSKNSQLLAEKKHEIEKRNGLQHSLGNQIIKQNDYLQKIENQIEEVKKDQKQKSELVKKNLLEQATIKMKIDEETEKIEHIENNLKECKERIIELEDSRKLYEILFSKWLTSQRLTEIAEAKKELEWINVNKVDTKRAGT